MNREIIPTMSQTGLTLEQMAERMNVPVEVCKCMV